MRYVKWRKPRGGVLRENGDRRRCMHCTHAAVHAAVRRDGKFSMAVWYCDEHAKYVRKSGQNG